jgi:hypothetical protein
VPAFVLYDFSDDVTLHAVAVDERLRSANYPRALIRCHKGSQPAYRAGWLVVRP